MDTAADVDVYVWIHIFICIFPYIQIYCKPISASEAKTPRTIPTAMGRQTPRSIALIHTDVGAHGASGTRGLTISHRIRQAVFLPTHSRRRASGKSQYGCEIHAPATPLGRIETYRLPALDSREQCENNASCALVFTPHAFCRSWRRACSHGTRSN